MGIIKRIFKKKEPTPTPTPTDTGVYQGPIQEGTSEAYFRTTGTTTPDPPPPKVYLGGGGGYIPPTTTPSVQTQIAQDIGPIVTAPQSTITPAVSRTGIKQAVSYYQRQRQMDVPVFQAGKGAGQIAIGGIKRDIQKAREKRAAEKQAVIDRESQNLQLGIRETSYAGKGTTTITQNQYTDVEVVKLGTSGEVSETAVLNELQRREVERYGVERDAFIKSQLPEIQNSGQLEYNKEYLRLSEQVQKGWVSSDEANRLLDNKAKSINEDINNKVTVTAEGWSESKGQVMLKESYQYLNKVSDKIKIAKTLRFAPVIIAGGYALGAVGAGIATLGATGTIAGTTAGLTTGGAIVQTAGVLGTGAAVVGTGASLYTSYKQGVLTASRVGSVILPQLLFIGGVAAGSKIGGKFINTEQKNILNNALNRADIETISSKAITTDSQITALKIPNNAKIDVIGKVKGGSSLRVSEYQVRGTNSDDIKTINKLLPTTKIKFVEVIDSGGNVINRIAIGEIKVGTGKRMYRENVLQEGSGLKVGENIVMDSIGLRIPEGKGITEVGKFRDVIKPTKTKYFMEDNALKRLVGAKSYTFEGKKITAPKGEQITFKNLQEVVNSEFKRYPSSKSKSVEIQRATNLKQINAIFEGGENAFGLNLKQIKFQTEGGRAVSSKIPKPFEFIRAPSTRVVKPFDVSKDLNLKGLEQPTGKVNQIFKQLNKQDSDLSIFPTFTKQIKTSVQAGVEKIITAKKYPSIFNFGLRQQQNIQMPPKKYITPSKNMNVFEISKAQIQKVIEGKNKGFVTGTTTTTIISPKQIEISLQSPAVTQKQIDKLAIIPVLKQKNILSPATIYPYNFNQQITKKDFKLPFFLIPPSISGGYQEKRKRLLTRKRKSSAAYTSSLLSAAFPTRAVPITKSQLKKLQTKTWSGAELRPMLSVVSDKKMEELIRKMKKQKGGSITALDFNPFENYPSKGLRF